MKSNKLLLAVSLDASGDSRMGQVLRPRQVDTMTRILKNIILTAVWLCLTVATSTVAKAQCILFPAGVGPEEVCVSGVFPLDVLGFPADVISVPPGTSVTVPLVEILNNTDRVMKFTIEAAGATVTSDALVVNLEPDGTTTFIDVILFTVIDSTPLRTIGEVIPGWSAFGSLDGADDYDVTTDLVIELRVDGLDSDGDGLLDSWETDGYDADGDGSIDVDLPAMGANPFHKDIFVELDWELGAQLFRESILEVKEAFALAPIDAGGTLNPDGQPGINLWVDTGELRNASGDLVGDKLGGGNELSLGPWTFGHRRCMGGIDDGMLCNDDIPCDLDTDEDELGICDPMAEFYHAKAEAFEPKRAEIFHYGILSSQIGGGQGEVGGNDIWLGATGDSKWLAYELMHEVGHNLNLGHGGQLKGSGRPNCEPNYISTMNYRYSYITWGNGETMIDYSPARFILGGRPGPTRDLEEASLDETVPLNLTDREHRFSYTGPPETCYAVCSQGSRHEEGCRDDDQCPGGTCRGIVRLCSTSDERCESHDDCGAGLCRDPRSVGGTCSEDSECFGGRCGGVLKTASLFRETDFNEVRGLETSVRQNIDHKFGSFSDEPCIIG